MNRVRGVLVGAVVMVLALLPTVTVTAGPAKPNPGQICGWSADMPDGC